MKLRRSLALLALAGAAACAGRAKPTPEALAGLPEGDYPLEAWLSYQRVSDLAFTVNQPAHVAIFHIAPGRGVSMLYPTYRDELDRTDPGYNVPGYRYDSGRWYFLNASFSRLAASPTYLLLVASREPLRVTEYERHPGLLRRALGLNTFASYDEWDVIDELAQLVVPPQPDDAWSTDLVVLWPGMRANSLYAAGDYFASRQLVRCDNGRILMVPESYPYDGCPFFSTYQPLPSSPIPQPQPEMPSDTTEGAPEPETPGEKPVSPQPVGPEPESADPKRGTPRRLREDVESGGESVRIAGEARRIGRRTRQAYPESSDERGARAWDRSTSSFTTPRQTTGSASSGRASRAGRTSSGRSDAGSRPMTRRTRSEPRAGSSSAPARDRSTSSDRSSTTERSTSSDRPSSRERPSSSSSERPVRP